MTLPTQTFGAHELKFALSDAIVGQVTEWAKAHIPADPYAGLGDLYDVDSLYFDSEDMSVFHRQPGFDDRKYRVRRYGSEGLLYLEEKEKLKGWVRKRRTAIPEDDLNRIEVEDTNWEGAWFSRMLGEWGLVPKSRVTYRRLARVGESEGGPIRLTIDRNVRCMKANGLHVAPIRDGEALAIDRNILELKFGRSGLPLLYKGLIREFGLLSNGSSKYRLSVLATGAMRERAGA
ncbi:polyphosphate polymerase domain-containing protein [bacterium]|nr:MAG: polyphosphate polymerase domain-containing protein [bacterium]